MTDSEKREEARQFFYKWKDKGQEIKDDRSFWIGFFQNVLGVEDALDRMEFQKPVTNDAYTADNRIDVYIPETKVLIEQKSLGIELDKPQPGHNNMTPFEQAKNYNNNLPLSEKAKWIITSNFQEIWIYDMDTQKPVPVKYKLEDIPSRYSAFEFLYNKKEQKITREEEISVKAGNIVGLIYDAFHKEYKEPDSEESLRSLNMLCVRLVFCLYAEDAHIFGSNGHMFRNYLEQFETKDMRKALKELFRVLNTPKDELEVDPYDDSGLYDFPYVNGGLFDGDDIEIPRFTEEIRDVLLNKASEGFDWSQISPTIFGAVFESTLNPETRRSGGMHYTSIENIHKIIDPLFLDGIKEKFDAIFYDTSQKPGYTDDDEKILKQLNEEERLARDNYDTAKIREIEKKLRTLQASRTRKNNLNISQQMKAMDDLQKEMASLTFLDPACGSGNFLTETYVSLRRIENDIISFKHQNQTVIGEVFDPIKVSIDHFYGIEVNDFAVTVAKTALWIAESQMMKETEDILFQKLEFLPLKSSAHIEKRNALEIDWNDIIPASELNYIMGNPPFVGYSLQTDKQKKDILSVYVDEKGKPYKTAGKIDYVAGWYFKAAQMMQGTDIRTAFVSTNSITQGEQVANVWEPVYNRFGIHIDFAYQTFIWDSEANQKANVHCVIVGFSCAPNNRKKVIYSSGGSSVAENINPYLINADNVFISSRSRSLCDVPQMVYGNKPTDGGGLFLSEEEYEQAIKHEPEIKKYIKQIYGSEEYINNKRRYCLWLVNAEPADLRRSRFISKRIEKVKEFRLKSTKEATRKSAETPTLFQEIRQPDTDYILVPRVSSQKRRYIPMGFVDKDIIASDSAQIIPNASLYHFGILESNIHMAWTRTVAGRLKSDYRYSKDIVYNNFIWPSPTEEQKVVIEKTAQMILDARAKYPNSSLADLYDPDVMPDELLKAHRANNVAVMKAYGFGVRETSEELCVTYLIKLYKEAVSAIK